MHRREFLSTAAVASLAAVEPSKNVMPIIDTHQHLWDLKKFRLPWIKDGDALAKDRLPLGRHQRPVGAGEDRSSGRPSGSRDVSRQNSCAG